MTLGDELKALMEAQIPLIHLVTYEEERVLRAIMEIDAARNLGITSWDVADGFQTHRPGKEAFPAKDCTSDTLLAHVAEKMPAAHILILRDFHTSWIAKRAYITRKLRNLAPRLREKSQYILFITPPLPAEQDLPRELKDDVVVLTVPLPDQQELARVFDDVTKGRDRSQLPRPEVKDKLIQSSLGLTTNQTRQALYRVWAANGKFDERGIDLITWAKKAVIRESGALEFWSAHEGVSDVGGLELLKEWLAKREVGFTTDAREAGLPFPRGVALIGIPGTGKSLSAKMVSGMWKLPLLRLDVGTLFGSLLGESEQNMRRAIMLAETVSPCILWIDEMEKAFAGSGGNSINAGAPTRVFGTFLTWMQEHRTPVFVIATANDIGQLPPELMGRFDRTFFLDLPSNTERRAIFLIHLKGAGMSYPERQLRVDELVEKTHGFVGREIERIVREAQFTAFADGNREIEQKDLLAAISETVPLNKSHQEVIEHLRKWKTEGRAFPASREEITTPVANRRILET